MQTMKKRVSPAKRSKPSTSSQKRPAQTVAFPIVGIGASAGGLEAVTHLLKHLPADTGIGFVLVVHHIKIDG